LAGCLDFKTHINLRRVTGRQVNSGRSMNLHHDHPPFDPKVIGIPDHSRDHHNAIDGRSKTG
jgi:hypothetical protein